MAQAVLLPKLGQTVEESTIVKWHKNVGDPVKKGEVLFELETDKAVLEAESFVEGTLLKIYLAEGETAPVSSVVAYVGQPGETVPDAPPAPKPTAKTSASSAKAVAADKAKPAAPSAPQAEKHEAQFPVPASAVVTAPASQAAVPLLASQPERLKISPRAKALARAKAIHSGSLTGTGPGGRIIEEDVLAYLESSGYNQRRFSPAAKQKAIMEGIDLLSVRGSGDGGRVMLADVERSMAERPRPLSRMRRIIAQRLTESVTTMPHFFVTVAVDMTALLRFRNVLKQSGDAPGVTDFINEAVVLSLVEFPEMNSRSDGLSVQWRGSVNLGVAVSLDSGLVVPVIANAQDSSLAELSATTKALVKKAREGRLRPDEMQGSTFTVSNMGMLDVENFTAIINPGEAAILAVGSAVEKPVVRAGEVVVRSIMKITLSSDHRIVDGSLAARFANAIKCKLEDMELWKALT